MKYLLISGLGILLMYVSVYALEPQPGQAYIQLSKKRCLGTCPVFDVLIYKNGTLVYRGIDHVPVQGERRFRLSEEKLAGILKLADSINLASLENVDQQRHIRDLPVTSLTIGEHKTSFRGQRIPERIKNFITALEGLVDI